MYRLLSPILKAVRPYCIAISVMIATAMPTAQAAENAKPRTVNDVMALLDQVRPDTKRSEELRAILASPPPQTGSKKDLAMYYLQRAKAAKEVGNAWIRVDSYRKIVEIGEAESRNFELHQLIIAEMTVGSSATALELIKKAISEVPPKGGQNVNLRTKEAQAYINLGDLENAAKSLKSAEDWNKSLSHMPYWPAYRYTYAKEIEMTRGLLLAAQGKYLEAEAAMRQAREAAIADIATIPIKGNKAETFEYEFVAEYLSASIAEMLAFQDRLSEAETIIRQVLNQSVARFGGYSYQTGRVLLLMIDVLRQQGRYVESAALANKALDIYNKVGAADDSNFVLDARAFLASTLVAQGNYREAIAAFQKIHAAFDAYPEVQKSRASGNADWALALTKTGNIDDAIAMLDRITPKSIRWLGAHHTETAILNCIKGMALAAGGQKNTALVQFRQSIPILLNEAVSMSEESSPLRAQRLRVLLEAYLSLLGEIRDTPMEQSAGIDAAGEAFRIVDALRAQSTQQAVAASAARASVDDAELGDMIRKEQDLRHEALALSQILRDLMTRPADQQLPKVVADMQKRIDTIRQERKALQSDIDKRFPAYANLIRPQPPTLAQARAALKPGEALINVFVTDAGSYVWAFKNDGPMAFAATKLSRSEVERMVQTLRKALDPGNVDIAHLPAFDLGTAYKLYAELLTPVASGWQGADTLLVAANGALSQLPFAVLPTAAVPNLQADPKQRYGQLKNVPWLVKQAAIAQLPSINALVSLRKLSAANAARAPFIGFGDPQFAMNKVMQASSGVRNLSIPHLTQRKIEQGESLEWIQYSQIPPLPDTRDEILALAKALKADPEKDIFLGAQASKANVLKTDLVKYKIVAFATHGLLPGDFPGVNEPSLALANPGDGRHGLLTLEDILKLKLDADWVILSACNTAAGEGAGSDAVSGLGRGFFYAGTRALLATHWPVESLSARLLVTGIFERQAADPRLTRAQALRQSMLDLMQKTDKLGSTSFSYAHPLFWAPYAVIGEGG